MQILSLVPGSVSLGDLEAVYRGEAIAGLSPDCRAGVESAAARVASAAAGEAAVYGVNTGFGKLASVKISAEKTAELQRNLVLSHSAGVGDPLPAPVVRLVLALKLISLGRGASGVRWDLIHLIEQMLEKKVLPVIPGQGSVGASGDLAPLAHMASVLIGEGEAEFNGKVSSGGEALRAAGLEPVALIAKEGLALINGTQVSTAMALAGLFDAHRLYRTALVTGALSTDAAMGSSAPFVEQIHTLRGHTGQIDAAASLRQLMEGSAIRQSHLEGDERVQDPYCLRCQPQVMGACLDLLRQAGNTLRIEANAVTDNPLILDEGIVSGGNFHAEPVAFAADIVALAIAEIGSIAERRIAMLVDPALNFGLPAFLTPEPGVNSGFMAVEVTAAALYSENKQRANPASIDSTPTSANQEDHVSMAAHGARRLADMNRNLTHIIGIELMLAAQGVHLRAPLTTSPVLGQVVEGLRSEIPALGGDRYMSREMRRVGELIAGGSLLPVAEAALNVGLEAA